MDNPLEQPASCRGLGPALPGGFLRQALTRSSLFQRAAGYFSSSAFSSAWPEYRALLERGRMEIVCNHYLDRLDIEVIVDALVNPNAWSSHPEQQDCADNATRCRQLLGWAIAQDHLHIRVATISDNPSHLYHEKFGLFLTRGQCILGFEGSANETLAGYTRNFERVSLHWPPALGCSTTCRRLQHEFDDLWHNRTPGLNVEPVLQALQQGRVRAVSLRGSRHMPDEWDAGDLSATRVTRDIPPEVPHLPDRLTLRDYQLEAARAWVAAGARGILEMATGSGKTITALTIATRLYQGLGGPFVMVVVAPYIHLVDQWASEARKFGLTPICCYGSASSWEPFAQAAIQLCNVGRRPFVSLVVTNATFSGARFQRLLQGLRVRTLLIADEVHNLGAPQLAEALPDRVTLRLGMSATPTRWLDSKGTDQLKRYFGATVFRFGLKEALAHDPPVLVPYRYHPILVDFEEDEQEQYVELTAAIGRCMSSEGEDSLSPLAKALLIKRSRLIASARQKLRRLREVAAPFSGTIHNLVYCGDGTVELPDEGDEEGADPVTARQIDAITRILGHDLGMRVAQFTAETPPDQREERMRDFSSGGIQALVAMRCLDEGVDIPAITRAFILASSSNPRQFVQRRGRILRRHPGKESAEIFDFLVRPPCAEFGNRAGSAAGRSLVKREMARVAEFAALAVNGPEARRILMPVLREWDLLHL